MASPSLTPAHQGTSVVPERRLGRAELTTLLALSIALAALGIDVMLPAFGDIRASLGLPEDSTAVAGLVTAYFLGLAAGQLAYGPIADRFGRRRALYIGYGIYIGAAVTATFAPTLGLLWLSRFVWGVGAAGPRVAVMAIVRDSYEGERMARAMSFIMAIFILVPVVAPTIGAVLTAAASWRFTMAACALAAAAMALWARRLPETLAPENRLALSPRRLLDAARVVTGNRQTVVYGLAMTALYGSFISWIASSEIILIRVFDQQALFPLLFGGLAAVMGGAMLLNARIVGAVGTRRLAHVVLIAYVVAASAFLLLSAATGGQPPLTLFLVAMAVMLASHALLIPNLNAIAMQPMASVAGTAAALIGTVQVAIGALLGSVLDRAFDGSIQPLAFGFLGYGVLAGVLVLWGERGRLFQPLLAPLPPEPQLDAEVV